MNVTDVTLCTAGVRLKCRVSMPIAGYLERENLQDGVSRTENVKVR